MAEIETGHQKPYCLLDAKSLRRILPFRAIQDVRYYLNGVYVEPNESGGCKLVATNGHMMAVVNSPTSTASEPLILRTDEYLCDAIQFKRVRHGVVRVLTKSSNVELLTPLKATEWMQAGPAFIDGRFPHWKEVISRVDESKPGFLGAFQAKYVRTALALMLKGAERENERAVTFFQKDPESVLSIRSEDLIVILMPVRSASVGDLNEAVPGWLQ